MLFRNNKEKLKNTREQSINQLIRFTDNLIDEMSSKFEAIIAIDESNLTPARKSLHRLRIVKQAQNELSIYSQQIKELSKTAKSIR